jgi:HSP20 family protein
MTTKRVDPIEELRPLSAGARMSEPGDVNAPAAESPLAYDVYRQGDELCIDFDVPGVEPASIHVSLEQQFLTVSVGRELPASGVEVIERGRVHGSFERRLVLPGHWRLDALRARCVNGVLQIRAPLMRASEGRAIAVEGSGVSPASRAVDAARLTPDGVDLAVDEREPVGSPA